MDDDLDAVVGLASLAYSGITTAPSRKESPCAPMTHPILGFHVYQQASHLSEECSPEVSVVAPSTHVPAPIDLNATPVASGSSSDGPRNRAREMSVDMLSGVRNLFEGMSTAVDDEKANLFMWSIIFEGDAATAGPPRLRLASIPKRPKAKTAKVSLDQDGFLLDHMFPDDYDLEEEDEVDIDGEPLFGDELANQAVGVQPKRKSIRTKA
ncbi:DNA repair protein rhp54 [Hordeum vulgare]|nr:DNA repair protein rhp54 [Hordeum vulgare]